MRLFSSMHLRTLLRVSFTVKWWRLKCYSSEPAIRFPVSSTNFSIRWGTLPTCLPNLVVSKSKYAIVIVVFLGEWPRCCRGWEPSSSLKALALSEARRAKNCQSFPPPPPALLQQQTSLQGRTRCCYPSLSFNSAINFLMPFAVTEPKKSWWRKKSEVFRKLTRI